MNQKDAFFPQLPTLQEKLTDAFKSNSQELHCEAFFFLRVLILRMTNKKISNIWPLVLSEMIRIFANALKEETPQLDISVLVSVCKFLDIAMILGIEELEWLVVLMKKI